MEVEKLIVRLVADASQYRRVFRGVENDLAHFSNRMGLMSRMIDLPLKAAVGGFAALSVGMAAAAAYGFKLAVQFEKIGIAMEVMTGDAAVAKKMVNDVVRLGIETPFQSPELLESAKAIKAFGFANEQILPTLKTVGEVSAGTGTAMERIILAFGQVKVAGRLMGPELRQFVDAGIPLIAALAKHLNVSEEAVRDLVYEGRVGFKDVLAAFNMMTGAGGIFENMMKRRFDSVGGQWSAFSETLQMGLKDLSLMFFDAFDIKNLLKGWRESLESVDMNTLISTMKDIQDVFSEMWAVSKFAFHSIVAIAKGIRDLVKANQELAVAFGIVAGILAAPMFIAIALSLGAILLKLAAITLAVTTLAVVLYQLGVAGDVFRYFEQSVAGIGKTWSDTWQGIINAMKGGDVQLAFDIGLKGLELGVQQLLARLKMVLVDIIMYVGKLFLDVFVTPISQVAEAFVEILRKSNAITDQTAGVWATQIKDGVKKSYDDLAKIKPAMVKLLGADDTLNNPKLKKLHEELGELTGRAQASAFMKDIDASDSLFIKGIGGFFEAHKRGRDLFGREDLTVDQFEAQSAIIAKDMAWSLVNFMMSATMGFQGRIPLGPPRDSILDEINPMTTWFSGDKQILIRDLRREIGKERGSGIGVGARQFDHFKEQLDMLDEMRYGPKVLRGQGLMGVGTGIATGLAQSIGDASADDHLYKFGVFRQFDNLRHWVERSRGNADKLPQLAMRGSTEAQEIINKQLAPQKTKEEEIRAIMEESKNLQKKEAMDISEIVEILRRITKEESNKGFWASIPGRI